MVDLNIEFTRGVLFVRLAGILNEVSSMDVEEKVFEIIKDGGIRFVVFNVKNLEMSDSVKLFDKCQKLLEENDGRMLICGDEMSAYDLEYVSDELSALKLLSI
jgi:anti-anti-sigma regulatory factor